MPKRIQRQRTKDWRMPEGAMYVGRPSRWGNPFVVQGTPSFLTGGIVVPDQDAAVHEFRAYVEGLLSYLNRPNRQLRNRTYRQWFLDPLRGRDLACWCPLDKPCHADVLLELANA